MEKKVSETETASEFPDRFRAKFKYYKSKKPTPDLSLASDIGEICADARNRRVACGVDDTVAARLADLGVTDPSGWRAAELADHPGLVVVANLFTARGQRRWARRCLEDYARNPPNRTNLDGQTSTGSEFVWYRAAMEDPVLVPRLRWATLGYHHDWDTKVYSEKNASPFPEDLSTLTGGIAAAAGFPSFLAEAAIVNFYPMDASLGGHTDHSERNLEAPLVSVSLGQPCVFLLGGRTREAEPTAMLLRSGDALIMSGEARRCYHGVPRIVRAKMDRQRPWQDDRVQPLPETREPIFLDKYLDNHRINLNVRQVN